LDSRAKAILAAQCLEEKKAEDIIALDVSPLTPLADYFIIATGDTKRHIKACVEYVEEVFAKNHIEPDHCEGMSNLEWVLMDYGDVIIHIFSREARDYYALERLWGDAQQIDYKTCGKVL